MMTDDFLIKEQSVSSVPYYVQALIRGYTWPVTTTNRSVTYTYNITNIYNDAVAGVESPASLTANQQLATDQALQFWESVANVHFVKTDSPSSNITFHQGTMPNGMAGWTLSTGLYGNITHADVVLDRNTITNVAIGSYGFSVLLHEIGHALGLKHPGNYNGSDGGTEGPYLPVNEDNTDYTLMSYYAGPYTQDDYIAMTPMLYDIASIQYLYGVNTSYHAGDDVYNLDGAAATYTLWDAGGSDTLSSLNYTGNAILDVSEGIDSESIVGETVLWVAFGAHVENAVSGIGNDYLFGSVLANQLTAGSGNDQLFGRQGNDVLFGNQGHDTLYGGQDNDILYGGQQNDSITGGVGDDFLYGNLEDDILNANDGNDWLHGGGGHDVLLGETGNDALTGGIGNDSMAGGIGQDIFAFNPQDDNDLITDFTHGTDLLLFSPLFSLSNNQIFSLTTYNASGAVITLGTGQTIALLGVTMDGLTAGDIVVG